MDGQINRKDQIIEVAIKRFSHFGFAKTTMNEIADDLNITKANLYYYYADKMTLIKDVILFISTAIHGNELEIIEREDNFIDRICHILEFRKDYMEKYSMLQMSENLEWIKGEDFSAVFTKVEANDIQTMQSIFVKGVESGELKEIDTLETTYIMLDVYRGLNFLCNISDIFRGIPNPGNAERILEKQKKVTELIYNGIKK